MELFKLPHVFGRVSVDALPRPDELDPSTGPQVARITRPDDLIPTFGHPPVEISWIKVRKHQQMEVWSAPALVFEPPHHRLFSELTDEPRPEGFKVLLPGAWRFGPSGWIGKSDEKRKGNLPAVYRIQEIEQAASRCP